MISPRGMHCLSLDLNIFPLDGQDLVFLQYFDTQMYDVTISTINERMELKQSLI
jgi:hypothetical protein